MVNKLVKYPTAILDDEFYLPDEIVLQKYKSKNIGVLYNAFDW